MNRMFPCGLTLLLSCVVCMAFGESYPVSNVPELQSAIASHNGDSSAEIVLAKGEYDVHELTSDNGHLSINALTLRGATGNPRDVVLYGNGTRRIIYGAKGAIRDLTISNGCARTGFETTVEGGGVYGDGNTTTSTVLSNVVVTCCSAQDGGGVARVTGYNMVINNNHAYNRGGGTFWGTYYDSLIHDNLSEKTGGGSFRGTYYHTEIVDNKAKGNGGGTWGGAIRDRSVIRGNESGGNGSGVYISDTTTVEDSDIVGNVIGRAYSSTASCGAGCSGGVVKRCLVAGNAILTVNKYCQGAAGQETTFSDCRILHNYSPNLGGALQSCTMTSCVISNNIAVGNYVIRQAVSLRDCDVYEASCNNLGAVWNCRFLNYTNGYVLAEGKNPYVHAGWYSGCESAFTGNCYLTNSLVAGYKVKNLICPGDNMRIDAINCTFADNWAKNDMSASAGETEDFTKNCARVINCIFARNRTQDGSAAQDFYSDSRGNTNVLFVCNLLTAPRRSDWKITESNTTVVADMKFDASNVSDPYSLLRKSPACGYGLVQDWMASATDIRRDAAYPRLREGKVDAGCYQCWIPASGLLMLVR